MNHNGKNVGNNGHGRHYDQVYDNQWFVWARRNNREQCCDCCLVHVSDYRIRNGKIEARYRRDNRATRRLRKRNGIKLATLSRS